MPWSAAINDWISWLRASGRPETTLYQRRYQLRRFAGDHPSGPFLQSTDDMVSWLTGQGWGAEAMRSARSGLRLFHQWGHDTGRADGNPAAKLPPIKAKSYSARPTPERLLSEALGRATPRVYLMIVMGARQGMRRGEIALAHSDDLIEGSMSWSLRVHGKGGKVRVVPLQPEVEALLRARPKGWVFPGRQNGHVSPTYVGRLVTATLGEVGWTTHTLRHRFATVTYQGSRDTFSVQDLLGHASPETTRRYVQLPQDALRAAMSWAA